MPDPIIPPPFYRTLVQSLVQTGQKTRVTAADTETATHWQVDPNGAARPTEQRTKLVGMDTETRTSWSAVSVKGGGLGLDEFVRGSAVVPLGTRPSVPVPARPGSSARPVSQSTVVTGAETLTRTSWKVDGEVKTPTAQDTRLESFDTRTRTRWVMDEKLENVGLPALPGLTR